IAADTAAEDVITEEKTAEIKLPKKRKEISADTAQDESGVTSEEKTVGEPVKKKKKTKIDDAVDIVKTEAVLADEAKSSGIDTSEEMKEKISEDIADEKVEERVIGARQIPHVAEDISSTPKEEKSKKKKKQKHSEAKTTEKNPQDKKSGGEPVEFDDDDIAENSTVAALSYLGLLIILPLMKADESPFCKAHSKQGIRVFVYSIIVMLATLALVLGLRALVVWVLGWSFVIYRILQFAVTAAMVILLIIPAFRGAVGAFSGEYRKVPFVGVDALKKKK
ncbi:MAG: DUF4870 domain-containing protein, partial [Clostridia bacterium]|nr:DUF4870 domain-containing protein [Clostridia bacterium]